MTENILQNNNSKGAMTEYRVKDLGGWGGICMFVFHFQVRDSSSEP